MYINIIHMCMPFIRRKNIDPEAHFQGHSRPLNLSVTSFSYNFVYFGHVLI